MASGGARLGAGRPRVSGRREASGRLAREQKTGRCECGNRRHPKAKHCLVLAIREASALGEHQRVIAARFGIKRNTVSGIVNHKSWAHLTKPVDGPQPALILERVPFVHLEIRGEVHS